MRGGNAYTDEEPEYLSYLLRLWWVKGAKRGVWRASLQSTRTRQEVGFAGLEEAFDYLRAETGVKVGGGGSDSEDERRGS